MLRRDRHSVVAAEPVGPYTLLRVERGRPRAGCARPVLHARGAGPRAAAADEPLARAARRARLPVRGDRARHERPRGARARATASGSSARSGTGSGWTSTGRCSSAGGSASRPSRTCPQTLDRPAAILGFRTRHHAEAAELVPNAEVVVEPTRVTELLEPGYDVLACGPAPMLSAVRELAPERPARLGGAHGLRVRRLLRLRRRGRRALQAPVPGGPRPCCLTRRDASMPWPLPDVARSLDAFVTKTVTPEPREGNEPTRIAETDHGMLNSIGLQNPGRERFLDEVLPRLRELGIPLWVSVGGFRGGRVRGDVRAAPRRHDRAQSVVPERRRSARIGRRDRRRLPGVDLAADLREALAGPTGHGRGGPRCPGGGRGRPLAREHDPRARAGTGAPFGPALLGAVGGYSGPALKPVALAAVYAAFRATSLPIVGMGGVQSGRDAAEFLAAGASAIAVGTALFADPGAPVRIRRELDETAASLGAAGPKDLCGIAHGPDFDPLPPTLTTSKTPAFQAN